MTFTCPGAGITTHAPTQRTAPIKMVSCAFIRRTSLRFPWLEFRRPSDSQDICAEIVPGQQFVNVVGPLKIQSQLAGSWNVDRHRTGHHWPAQWPGYRRFETDLSN